jgi:hypothetical protein
MQTGGHGLQQESGGAKLADDWPPQLLQQT